VDVLEQMGTVRLRAVLRCPASGRSDFHSRALTRVGYGATRWLFARGRAARKGLLLHRRAGVALNMSAQRANRKV